MCSGIEPYRECPRFSKCSVNNCPLHPSYPNLYKEPSDPEPRCTLPKSYRLRVGQQYGDLLSRGGLTVREFTAQRTWENMDPLKKQDFLNRAKLNAFSTGLEVVSAGEG